jgi:N-acetyl sugar amidotransferase
MPATKPDLLFDEDGVCNACDNYEKRPEINWAERKKELTQILEKYKAKDGTNYDCIIPVSGGKDSHFQVITMLSLGMNPLCVTATTDKLSDIGRRNIENIKNLGVDYVEVSLNPKIRRKINRLALTQVGDISWPEHVAIFTVPVRLSVQMNIPLIVWGENSQNEYGGPVTAGKDSALTRRWLEEFGGLLGMRVSDLLQQEDITEQDLIQYTYPTDAQLKSIGTTGLFLGYYMPWDGYQNAEIAKKHGFATYHKEVEGSIVDYENLDNYQTGIHDYFKFLKFGFGRATDLACLHIRRGRLNREEALKLIKKHDGKFPWEYLGCSLEEILKDIDVSLEEFIEICDKFTNKKLFVKDQNGNLLKNAKGNLTKINYDNEHRDN